MNVRPDDIFRTAESFVIKLGVVIHHHVPECHAKKSGLQSPRSKSYGRLM